MNWLHATPDKTIQQKIQPGAATRKREIRLSATKKAGKQHVNTPGSKERLKIQVI